MRDLRFPHHMIASGRKCKLSVCVAEERIGRTEVPKIAHERHHGGTEVVTGVATLGQATEKA